MFKRLIATLICLTFSISNLQQSQAQDFSINQLPVPGTMIGMTSPFAPLALKGLVVNPLKPLEFQFIVDTGHGPQDIATIKDQANQLVKYFLAGLTIPSGDLWVNLSPYEKNRIVPEVLGQTDLGRDLLAQDYILKQLTASLIYPENGLGKEFWSRVYSQAQEQFGTTNVPVNTFNKVWILPKQAQVFEHGNAAYVTKSTLKVMLEEDYLSLKEHNGIGNVKRSDRAHTIASQIVRAIVLPEIEKEVNTGKNFAPLRQIYQALILAKWYKETIQNGLLDAVYTNKNKINGVNLQDPAVKEQIYERYLQAYKKGAFNYIKEEPTPDGQVIPRKYFSGGEDVRNIVVERGAESDVGNPDGAMFSFIANLWKPRPFDLGRRQLSAALGTGAVVTALSNTPVAAIAQVLNGPGTAAQPQLPDIHALAESLKDPNRADRGDAIRTLAGLRNILFENRREQQATINRMIPYIHDLLVPFHSGEWTLDLYNRNAEDVNRVAQIASRQGYQQDADFLRLLYLVNRSTYARHLNGSGPFTDGDLTVAMHGVEGITTPTISDLVKKDIENDEVRKLIKAMDGWGQADYQRDLPIILEGIAFGTSAAQSYYRVARAFRTEEIAQNSDRVKRDIAAGHVKLPKTIQALRQYSRLDPIPVSIPDVIYNNEVLNKGDDNGIRSPTYDWALITRVPGKHASFGGIDLNQIYVNRTGKIIKVRFDQAQLSALMQDGFDGFSPVITGIRRISSPLPLMGIN